MRASPAIVWYPNGMARRSNSRVARGISTSHPDAASWLIFDGLPRPLRAVLHAAPVAINPVSARTLLDSMGGPQAVCAIREAIDGEVRQFATMHRRQHGYDLPHVAAWATLQPYQVTPSAMNSRSRRRR